MNKPEINQEVYEQYLDATVALFMEHYSAMLTEKISTEGKDENVSFPEALDIKCKSLFKKEAAKQKRLTLWKHTKRTLKVAAAFAIAVMTLFSALFVSVDAFRVKVINFYIENKNGYWSISGNQNTPQNDNTAENVEFDINDPLKGLIPDDYVLTTISNSDPQRITATYERSSTDKIRLLVFPYDMTLHIDSENANSSKEIKILEHDGILSQKGHTSQIAWCNKATGIMYTIFSNSMEENDLFALAEHFARKTLD